MPRKLFFSEVRRKLPGVGLIGQLLILIFLPMLPEERSLRPIKFFKSYILAAQNDWLSSDRKCRALFMNSHDFVWFYLVVKQITYVVIS